jgi:hypothetical protein
MHKIFIVTLAIAGLIGANSNALADGNLAVVTHIVGGTGQPPLVSLSAAHRGPLVARDDAEDAGLIKIANNFTRYKYSPYWGWFGYEVWGPQVHSAYGTENWLATAFTPKANHLATKVEVAAIFYGATEDVVLSLYDDAGGLPGKPLHSWPLTNLPHTVCCTVVGGSDKGGIPLTGGKQYWVVIRTSAKEPAAAAVWALTEFANVQQHGTSWAAYCAGPECAKLGFKDHAWHIYAPILYGLAFAVLGK